MQTRGIFLILTFSLLFITIATAETNSKNNQSIIISCAYNGDEALQLMALDSLLAEYRKMGTLEREILLIPENLAQNTLVNIKVRLKAIDVLGEIGGENSLISLSGLLMSSNDTMILTEAVKSSSNIDSDDYRNFINALGTVMKKQHSLFMDNSFAITALNAIDKITETAGNILTSEIMGMMMLYSGSEYDQHVKEYSRSLLQKILSER